MQDVRKDREKYIGGSDIPIILGISPFRTRWELLREKALGEMDDFQGNEYTEYGNIMEPKIRGFVNSMTGLFFVEDKIERGNKRYHADGYDEDAAVVLEVKTTGEYDDRRRKIYLAQLLYGMHLYKAEKGILGVYERPEDMDENFDPLRLSVEEIKMADHAEYMEQILAAVAQFDEDVEALKKDNSLTQSDLVPAEITNIAYAIEDAERKLKAFDELSKACAEMKENLRQLMNEHHVKSWETPNGTKITLVLDGEDKEVMEFNKAKFEAENPEKYAAYCEPKIKKGRKGYVRITYARED